MPICPACGCEVSNNYISRDGKTCRECKCETKDDLLVKAISFISVFYDQATCPTVMEAEDILSLAEHLKVKVRRQH